MGINYMTHERFRLPQLDEHVDMGGGAMSIGRYFTEMLDPSMNWEDVTEMVRFWGGQFCLKGVMSVDDAKLLRVGATPQVIENLLADFLAQYERRHPLVEVELKEAGGARLGELLDRGEIEVAIMPAGDARFQARALYPMSLLAVLPEGHRLSRRHSLEVAELEGEPLMLLGRDFASQAWFAAACQIAHVRPRAILESGAPQTIVALARTGRGIAIVPSPVRIPRDGVRIAPVVHRGASIGRWTVAAWDSRRFFAPYAELFVKEIAAATRRDYPGPDLIRRAPPLPEPRESES